MPSSRATAVSPSTEARAAAVARELRRRKLIRFASYVQDDYKPSWHHELLASRLDAVRLGHVRRLLVFMPPQHGKSALISRHWPAHLLGNEPDTKIIATSYSSDLADFNAQQVRRTMKSRKFRELFRGVRLAQKKVGNGGDDATVTDRVNFFELPGRAGYYLGAGIMGSMTGFGFDVGIIDDPIRNQMEADSEGYRRRLKDAWSSVFETRGRGMDGPGGLPDRIVGVFTRWHDDDLAGHLLRISGEQWEVLTLPAIRETERDPANPEDYDPRERGEALWPQRYPVSEFDRRRKTMPIRTWYAMYQQTPRAEDGGTFPRKWWRFFDPADAAIMRSEGRFDRIWQTWDANFKKTGTSRVAGFVLGKKGADFYVLDRLELAHLSYVELKDSLRRAANKWPDAYEKVMEDRANGPAVISDLASELGGFVPWPPPGVKFVEKQARWNAATPPVRSGNVLLPRGAPWVDEFIDELQSVPTGRFDDQADAFAQGILFDRDGYDPLDGLGQY